jgi:hypothetical protein
MKGSRRYSPGIGKYIMLPHWKSFEAQLNGHDNENRTWTVAVFVIEAVAKLDQQTCCEMIQG